MSINIDRVMNKAETFLSQASVVGVVIPVAGVTKVAMGCIQATLALAISILSVIPAAASGNWSITDHAWTHVKHGVGNMIAGTFEAIPLVNLFICYLREQQRGVKQDSNEPYGDKFMPYPSLIKDAKTKLQASNRVEYCEWQRG